MRRVSLAIRLLLPILAMAAVAAACGDDGGPSGVYLRLLTDVKTDCPGTPTDIPPAHEVIAGDILTRSHDDLLFDGYERAELEAEIEKVLDVIRRKSPATADIPAVWSYFPGQVLLGLEGSLREDTTALLEGGADTVTLMTGHTAFDQLNAKLGLQGISVRDGSDEQRVTAMLCFDELLNVPLAAEAYSKIDGIAYSEPNFNVLDTPDIDAALDGDSWYVTFREASGDCPAGCTHEKLFFFTVTDDQVTQVVEEEALGDRRFKQLAALVGLDEPPE